MYGQNTQNVNNKVGETQKPVASLKKILEKNAKILSYAYRSRGHDIFHTLLENPVNFELCFL